MFILFSNRKDATDRICYDTDEPQPLEGMKEESSQGTLHGKCGEVN